jgi:Xaa-Pro aminopeptidase
MDERQLDALVASSPENVSYLADIPRLPAVMDAVDVHVVVFREPGREPAIIMPAVSLDHYAQSRSEISDVRIYNPFYYFKSEELDYARLSEAERRLARIYFERPLAKGLMESLVQILRERGLIKGRIGFDEANVPASRIVTIKRALSRTSIVRAKRIFEEIRMIKSEEEIERIRKAVEATEKGIQAVMEAARPGVVNRELHFVYQTTVMRLGCAPHFAAIAAGTEGALVNHLPSDYVLKDGDTIRIDCNAVYRNYLSDVGRNAVLGRPSEKVEKYCQALIAGLDALEQTVRPGVKLSNLFEKAVTSVRKAGIPHYQRQNVGHSIGLQVVEPPVITPDNDLELQENMVIAIETPYYEIGFGSFNPEETILVTKGGSERLTKTANRLYVL